MSALPHPPADPPRSKPGPVPERFLVRKGTLVLDRVMTGAIQIGGIAIIVAVFAILIFIGSQVVPLFRGPSTAELAKIALPTVEAPRLIGMDEWAELPFAYDGLNTVRFFDHSGTRVPWEFTITPPEGATVSASRALPDGNRILLGASDGKFAILDLGYQAAFDDRGKRTIDVRPKLGTWEPIGKPGSPIVDLAFGNSGARQLVAAVQRDPTGGTMLHAVTLVQKRSLMGAGKISKDREFDLTPMLSSPPQNLLVPGLADSILVCTVDGEVDYLFLGESGFELRQRFRPFEGSQNPAIARMDFVFGDVSVVFSGHDGKMVVYSLAREEGGDRRVFLHTKTFPNLPEAPTFFVASQRNKSFLVGGGTLASLRHTTTEAVRWQQHLPFTIRAAALGPKFDAMIFAGDDHHLHLYSLSDPHPEAGWKAFFGKVWYEGFSRPMYAWQSTGGSDDFEPKFSQIPLIVGSLKGTLYALLFAVPIALLAAIYAANFCRPEIRRVVKPAMEIMASLPSVVLGFLAALWLAPLIERRVPSVLLLVLALPLCAVSLGWVWGRLPLRIRSRVPLGFEFLVFRPVMLLVSVACWRLGPLLEQVLFVATDPTTGLRTADFRLWWPQVTGTPFEQRNSLVVGFMMGFAVIPIIFTISEDALSNVPSSLTAASAALGASRWQTTREVVLPIAAAGIFSALMIGFGRAVGETMIMVMATGNTAIMDFNIFSGMRTLAANIAVELPEAAQNSTHYRTLYLGAVILFLFTFVLNTIAEILRQRLREKFKLI